MVKKGQFLTRYDDEIWYRIDSGLKFKAEDFSPGLVSQDELSAFQSKKRAEKKQNKEFEAQKKKIKKDLHKQMRERFYSLYPDMLYRKIHPEFKCNQDFVLKQKCSYGDCECENTGRLPKRPVTRLFP